MDLYFGDDETGFDLENDVDEIDEAPELNPDSDDDEDFDEDFE